MKKWMLSLLCSLELLVTMLPMTALAGGDNSFTFESLETVLQNESGTGIYFKPDANFVWPADGGTLVFKQNLYPEGGLRDPCKCYVGVPEKRLRNCQQQGFCRCAEWLLRRGCHRLCDQPRIVQRNKQCRLYTGRRDDPCNDCDRARAL